MSKLRAEGIKSHNVRWDFSAGAKVQTQVPTWHFLKIISAENSPTSYSLSGSCDCLFLTNGAHCQDIRAPVDECEYTCVHVCVGCMGVLSSRAKVSQRPTRPGALSSRFSMYPHPTGHADADGDGIAHVPPERIHVPQDARSRPEQPTHAGHGPAQQRAGASSVPQEAMRTCMVGEGRRGWGTGETSRRWWVSGETLEEIRVIRNFVAKGSYCSVIPVSFSLTSTQSNSV